MRASLWFSKNCSLHDFVNDNDYGYDDDDPDDDDDDDDVDDDERGVCFQSVAGGQHIKWQPWDGQSIYSPSDLLKISLSTSTSSPSSLSSSSS